MERRVIYLLIGGGSIDSFMKVPRAVKKKILSPIGSLMVVSAVANNLKPGEPLPQLEDARVDAIMC